MDIVKQTHHCQQELCSTRPCYRQGKKLTAVKVYTVIDESRHLLISQVPAIKLQAELCALCNRFGDITTCSVVPQYEDDDKFVETYHVQYSRIQASRFAKKQLDGRSFFGGILHVCYAPELETVNETREKLVQRRKEIATRVKKLNSSGETAKNTRTSGFIGSNAPTTSSAQDVTKYVMPHTVNQTQQFAAVHEGNHSYEYAMEASTSQCSIVPEPSSKSQCSIVPEPSTTSQCSIVPEPAIVPTTNHIKSSVSNSTLKFVPRSVTVSKRIVFHKK